MKWVNMTTKARTIQLVMLNHSATFALMVLFQYKLFFHICFYDLHFYIALLARFTACKRNGYVMNEN